MCDELGMPRGTDVRALCDDLRTKTRMTALGTANSASQAVSWKSSWVPGTIFLYALADSDVQYLAVGRAVSCEIDGESVRGTWDVLKTFGTELTRQAVEYQYCDMPGYNVYDSVLSWAAPILPQWPIAVPSSRE
jgi:hypothetical protein